MPAFSKPILDSLRRHHVSGKPLIVLVATVLLLTRSRLLALPKETLRGISRVAKYKQRLSPRELDDVLQQVYVKEEDGSKTLLVPYRDRVSRLNIKETPPTKFASDAPFFPPLSTSTKSKPNVDVAFLRQLRAIIFRVAFPSLWTKETMIVGLHSFFLIMRTVLSVIVAKLDGRIARDLVSI
ncbi:hypothetical protein C0993_006969 [Termitomyces sp. T159_Od127]|nr:hypothetical protein C0993_006969 [Termitomyces sp. T159_Od127]